MGCYWNITVSRLVNWRPHLPPHLVGVNTGGEFWQDWRVDGRKGRTLIPPRSVSLCSGEEIWHRWDRKRTFLGVSIPREMMRTAAYEEAPDKVQLTPQPSVIDPVVDAFISSIYSDVQAGRPNGPLLADSLVTGLIAYLLRAHSVHPVRFRRWKGGIPRARLQRVIDYIEAVLSEESRISELASVAEMSPYYFGKLFKQSTGWTVHQYVMRRRLCRAMSLLVQDRITIAQVGALVGMHNQSQFARFFHQQAGATPYRFRSEFL